MQDESTPPAQALGSQPDAPDAAAPDTAPEVDKMPSPEELLRQAELRAEEHRDAWLRAKAESENARKRAATEIAQARKYAIESFSTELLAVKDSLEAALAVRQSDVDSYRSGVEMTLRQLSSVFEKFNVTTIDPLNEKLDPYKHQAISTVPSDAEPNTVVAVLQKGYALHDRILRPALVTVAKRAD
jgi:molecular chaperone GrpE